MAEIDRYMQLEWERISGDAVLELSPVEFRLFLEIDLAIRKNAGIGRYGVPNKKGEIIAPKPIKFPYQSIGWKCSRDTFYRGLATLEERGFIRVHRPPLGGASTIELGPNYGIPSVEPKNESSRKNRPVKKQDRPQISTSADTECTEIQSSTSRKNRPLCDAKCTEIQSLITNKNSINLTTTTNQAENLAELNEFGGGGGNDASQEFEKAKAEYEARVQARMRRCYKENQSSRIAYDADQVALRNDAEESLRFNNIFPPTPGGLAQPASAQPEPEDVRTDAEAIAEKLGGGLEIVEEALRTKDFDWALGHTYQIKNTKGIYNPVGVFKKRLKENAAPVPVNGRERHWLRQREGACF